MTLGLAEPLNYGLSMPPEQLRTEWAMLRHAEVSVRVGRGLIVDRRDATWSPCSLIALQTVGDFA